MAHYHVRFEGAAMEKYLLHEHVSEGCRRMVWELRYKAKTFHITTQDTIRSVDGPEDRVWIINQITATEVGGPLPRLRTEAGGVSIIGMRWKDGQDPAEISYPTPEAAVDATAAYIDDWLREHNHVQ